MGRTQRAAPSHRRHLTRRTGMSPETVGSTSRRPGGEASRQGCRRRGRDQYAPSLRTTAGMVRARIDMSTHSDQLCT